MLNGNPTARATWSILRARTIPTSTTGSSCRLEPVRLRDGCRIKVFDHELIFRDPTVGLRKDEEERSTVLGSIDDLSSIRLARRLAQPTEAIKAILDVNRALGGTDLNDVFGRVLDGLMAVFGRAEADSS